MYKDKKDQAASAKRHYEANKDKCKQRAINFRRKNTLILHKLILNYLVSNHCIDCGESDPIVLEFDHRPGETKKFSIACAKAKGCSPRTLEEEIKKCEIRCANCHRKITYKQLNWKSKENNH